LDFLFDFFYEILSEEGIWVLILIGAALAVASFILLTMRLETSPRQRGVRQVKSTRTVEEKNSRKSNGHKHEVIKIKEKEEKGAKNGKGKRKTEVEEPEAAKDEDSQQDIIEHDDSRPSPIRPEMVSPDSFTKPEVEIPEQTPAETPEEPSLETAEYLPAPDKASTGTTVDIIDPFALPDLDNPGYLTPDKSVYDRSEPPQTEGELETEDTMALASEDESSEDSAGEDNGGTDNIFDLFESVEDEESEIAELAKNLDNVALDVFLNDTEGLAKDIKDFFPKTG